MNKAFLHFVLISLPYLTIFQNSAVLIHFRNHQILHKNVGTKWKKKISLFKSYFISQPNLGIRHITIFPKNYTYNLLTPPDSLFFQGASSGSSGNGPWTGKSSGFTASSSWHSTASSHSILRKKYVLQGDPNQTVVFKWPNNHPKINIYFPKGSHWFLDDFWTIEKQVWLGWPCTVYTIYHFMCIRITNSI